MAVPLRETNYNQFFSLSPQPPVFLTEQEFLGYLSSNVRSVVQLSSSMIVSDTYEKSSACRLRVDGDARGRLTNDRRGRQIKLNPACISKYPSSTLQDNETHTKLLRDFTYGPSDYYNVRPLVIIHSYVYPSLLT